MMQVFEKAHRDMDPREGTPMMRYVCKYTPVELLEAFGANCEVLDGLAEDSQDCDGVVHANLCGFGKAVVSAAMVGQAEALVLVNCCDVMRRVYDVLKRENVCSFLYLIDLPHEAGGCGVSVFTRSIEGLADAYASYSGNTFDREAFIASLAVKPYASQPYVGILGARVGRQTEEFMEEYLGMGVRNLTCVGARQLASSGAFGEADPSTHELMEGYARMLLGQIPCYRMKDTSSRRHLFEDPDLQGIIYHTIKFCDYYGFEYAGLQGSVSVPLLKVETDYTRQSTEQLKTRIEAFSESLGRRVSVVSEGGGSVSGLRLLGGRMEGREGDVEMTGAFVVGIDSGSTSTDVVILDRDRQVVAQGIIPTGGGASMSAERSLGQALSEAGIARSQIARIVTTGYGRSYIDDGDDSITEITCHAVGAHHLDPDVRTIIDIGGQDSKVIRIDAQGAVTNFVMNDKCAAGTGRFLEMMARALGLSLAEMADAGLSWKEDVTISSMCTVFAESEVVSLVAQNKAVCDIVHGLNNSVASKVATLVNRVGLEDKCMMTGGVAQNEGVVRALEHRLGTTLVVSEQAQLCGALGAALLALE